jgi:flagellar biosynthetic protein FliQ
MNQEEVIEAVREAVMLVIQISSVPLIAGLVIGVAIALFQALTQIQEITLVFVPKIMVVLLSIFLFFPSMAEILSIYMESLSDRIASVN